MYPVDNLIVYDLEVFPGWFEAGFELPSGEIRQYVITDTDTSHIEPLRTFLEWVSASDHELVGFNSRAYDDLVLSELLKRPVPATAYATSVAIIVHGAKPWAYTNTINSIDLMPLLPGRIGLKRVGVCLGHSKLQELPIAYDTKPTAEEQDILLGYNVNDLQITRKLLNELQSELNLRAGMSQQYDIDLRSKGGPQIAEAILGQAVERLVGITQRQLNDRAHAIIASDPRVWVVQPAWWKQLDASRFPSVSKIIDIGNPIFSTPIPIADGRLAKGFMDQTVFIGDRYYTLGVGGLHSVDGPGCWKPDSDEFLCDIDIASMYPSTMILNNLSPRQCGNAFMGVYQDLYRQRLDAKHNGDKTVANSLKLVLNSTFGLTSSPYSAFYDPQLTANVTVVGQLAMLTLIAMLDGIADIASANTDGLLVLGKKTHFEEVRRIVEAWETMTGYVMEYSPVSAHYQRDVNAYVSLSDNGELKTKGRFVAKWPDLSHAPSANIVALAIQARIKDGTPIEETIRACRDLNQLILTQSVKGNGSTSWNGRPLGKMLRFYKSNHPDAAPIIRSPGPGAGGGKSNVPNSKSCVPLEDYPETFPADVDFDWYVKTAMALWVAVSHPKARGMNRWAQTLYQAGLRPCYVEPGKPLSRARVVYGAYDFSSRPPGAVMGTGTGEVKWSNGHVHPS